MEHHKKPTENKPGRERRSRLRFSDLHRLADDAVQTHIHGKHDKTDGDQQQRPEKRK